MKRALRIAAMSLLPLTGAQAQDPPGGTYVYLGSQSGGKAATMVFVNNTSFSHPNDKVTATTLWVTYPPYPETDADPEYVLKDDVYNCSRGTVSARRTRTYSKNDRLLAEKAESAAPVASALRSLPGQIFSRICSSGASARGAGGDLGMTVIRARLVMLQSMPKTGKFAYPEPPQPVTIGYYPFGIAPIENVPLPPGGAYRIPPAGKEASIFPVYRAPDGHIILQYYRRGYGSDYFDTALQRNLFPEQAQAMAKSGGGLLGEKLKPPGLRRLSEEMFRFARPSDKDVFMDRDGGNHCSVPYHDWMQVEVDGRPEDRIALFSKREKPESSEVDCGDAVPLNYDTAWLHFLAADPGGFFAKSDEAAALIRFDWRGHSAFFAGQDTLIAVPYAELLRVLHSRGEDETPDSADFRKAEALIADYGRRQMQGASPLAATR